MTFTCVTDAQHRSFPVGLVQWQECRPTKGGRPMSDDVCPELQDFLPGKASRMVDPAHTYTFRTAVPEHPSSTSQQLTHFLSQLARLRAPHTLARSEGATTVEDQRSPYLPASLFAQTLSEMDCVRADKDEKSPSFDDGGGGG